MSPRLPFATIGFDLDGTLVDTAADITAGINHALALAGRRPLTIDQVRPKIGGGARRTLRQALDESGGAAPAEFQRLSDALLDYYGRNIAVHSRPYDGALAALDRLAAAGVTLGIVTNKVEGLAVKLLTDLKIIDRLAVVIGGDTLGKGNAKPAAAPIHAMIARCGGGAAAFVGDSSYDVQAARNAGVPSVAVSFGFIDSPVDQLGADAVIDHFDDLLPALARLSG